MKRSSKLLALFVLFTSLGLGACAGCGEDNNGQTNNGQTNNGQSNNQSNNGTLGGRPTAGPDQEVVIELPEVDLASVAVNGYLPNLEDPISPEESRALIEAFDWADTEPLPETSPDGRNSMWYVLIYLDGHDSARALRESGIYHDMLPLFGEERERWAGEVGAFRFRGDGEGIFAFAVLHGQIYNTLRELALEGEPAFRGIVLREPPQGATQSDGSLDYEYLAARGFRYGAPIEMPSEDEPADTVTRQQAIAYVPGMPISILRAQVALGFDAIDELRRAATEVAGFFGGESQFMIEVDVLNSDPEFAGDSETLMRSAWRRGGGTIDSAPEIELTGANVRLQTDLLLADAPLGSDGITRINAYNDTAYTVCIAARNAAAEVSEFLTPIIACHFAPPAVDDAGDPVDGNGAVQTVNAETLYHRVVVKDYALNILAQFTDAREYMRRSVGIEPRQARALTGPYADLLGDIQGAGGEGDRAFAACNGGDFIDLFAGIVAAAAPWLGPLNVGLEPFRVALANDVLFPGVGEVFLPGHVSAAVSRGVPTHEYGHFAMCELLRQTDPHTFMTMWIDVSLISLGGQSVDTAQLWTVEGWADFFTYQVAGGTNYFGFDTSWMGGWHTGVYYCDPARTPPAGVDMHPACMEENVGGSGPLTFTGTDFDFLAATVATVLHDAFDAPGSYLGEPPDFLFAPDGAWTNLGAATGARFRAGRGSAGDEDVSLPPEAIRRIFHHLVWAPNLLLTPRAFYDAIARTLTDYGFESDDICAMFALHDPAGDCFNLISRGALDTTDSMPSTPFNLTGEILAGNDAIFQWEDGSFFATGWAYELRGGSDVRTGEIPFDFIPTHLERDLLPNTEYTFTIHTVNGANRSPGEAVLRLTTNAQSPTITSTTGLPGAIALTWSGGGSSEYIVEIEYPGGELQEVGRTSATSYQINGLDGGTPHRVRVFGVNRNGVPSAPSAWESVTTQAVTTVYVATTGDDTSPGSAAAPVATLGRALQLAKAAGAQLIDLEAGTYVQPTPLVVDFPVTIRGTSRSEIRVQSLRPGFSSSVSCGAADFDATSRATFAALYVSPGANLYLRDVALFADEAVNRNACIAAIDSDGGELRVIDSEIGVYDGALTDVPCAVGVLARNMSSISFSSSDVYGFRTVAPIGAASVDAAAVCIGGSSSGSVYITESSFEPFGGGFPAATVASVYGVIADTATMRIARSSVFAQGRRTNASVSAGPVAGLWARVETNLLIDNSAFLTPRGGSTNDAIYVQSVATPILLSLVHVTANVGGDWGDRIETTPGHEGNAMRIAGQVSRLEIINSLLSHAGGFSPTGWGAALNIGEVTTKLCDFSIRGNAFAAADRSHLNGRSALVIRDLIDPEFGFITRGVNSYGTYSVDACAAGARTQSNLEMYNAPGAPNLVTVVPAVDGTGYPTSHFFGTTEYAAPRDALLGGGIPLDSPSLPPYSVIGTDLAGTDRPQSSAPSIGAYTR